MIHDLRPYPTMKDSGIPWLGQVPEHWDVKSLGSLTRARSERNRPDLPLLSVVREKGVILRDRENKDENHNFIPDDLSNYKVVREGDLVVNKMKAWQGSMGLAPVDGIVSPAYFVFDFSLENRRYGQALLRSPTYVSFFAQASDGVRIGQWDLSVDGMKRIPVLVPPPDEQAAIVRFLDHADRRIHKAIAAKQKLIRLLQEQKQVIIHQAVTRGLDPNVKLKPSGVEWLGDVPEHWKVVPAKRLFREVDRRSATGEEVLLSLRMYQGLVPHTSVSDVPITASALIGYKHIGPGQLVMNRMRAAIGMFGLATHAGLVSPDYAVFDVLVGVEPNYFLRLFKTRAAGGAFRLESKGLGTGSSGFMRLYTDRFGRIGLPLPPLEEQRSIVEAIDESTQDVEVAISRAQQEISLLREYRTRLIADVVTGKLDVREAAARLPEPTEEAVPEELEADVEGELEANEVEAEVVEA